MLKKMILMHGVSGGGKTTKIRQFLDTPYPNPKQLPITNETITSYCSTDKYWIRPDGRYDWNFRLLGEAHDWNRSMVEAGCKYNSPFVVVDNTNLTWKEVKPFVEIAKEYGYEVEIVESDAPWRYDAEECAKRNTHGVPLETIKKMLAKRESVEELTKKAKELLQCV